MLWVALNLTDGQVSRINGKSLVGMDGKVMDGKLMVGKLMVGNPMDGNTMDGNTMNGKFIHTLTKLIPMVGNLPMRHTCWTDQNHICRDKRRPERIEQQKRMVLICREGMRMVAMYEKDFGGSFVVEVACNSRRIHYLCLLTAMTCII